MRAKLKRLGRAYTSYSLCGGVFSVVGPLVFWLLYPLGPFAAVLLTEAIMHLARYRAFKILFRKSDGYKVLPGRYVASITPVVLANVAASSLLYRHVGREVLIVICTLTSMTVGFLWTIHIMSHEASE